MQPREVPAVLDMVSDLSKHTGTVLGMLGGKFLCIPEKTRMNGNLASMVPAVDENTLVLHESYPAKRRPRRVAYYL